MGRVSPPSDGAHEQRHGATDDVLRPRMLAPQPSLGNYDGGGEGWHVLVSQPSMVARMLQQVSTACCRMAPIPSSCCAVEHPQACMHPCRSMQLSGFAHGDHMCVYTCKALQCMPLAPNCAP